MALSVHFISSLSFCMAKIFSDSQKIFGDAFASTQIFNAILSSLFSAAAELATLKHPRRPIQSDALEELFRKAKSSMVASDIPKYFIISSHTKWEIIVLSRILILFLHD